MWVYGDAERTSQPQALAGQIAADLESATALPHGLGRHAAIVRAFVDASELIQGLIDAAFHERGFDTPTAEQDSLIGVLFELAEMVERSWRSHFSEQDCLSDLIPAIAELGQAHSDPLTTRSAEGYSVYALYPETYLDAAYRSSLGPDTIVIGIRSIGLSLSTLVAAALKAKAPISLRPVGDPFARKINADPQLLKHILDAGAAPIAIVDEGPGLSGSSFFAVADWLERGGVRRDRIHFFPSHGGEPGGQATDDHRERWRHAPRHVSGFDETFSEEQSLERWITDLLGPLDQPLTEISGGRWRLLGAQVPVDARLERRKVLAHAQSGSFLVKFAGLGAEGSRKFEVARRLFQAGFVAEPVALLHGMIVERWVESQPLTNSVDRCQLVGSLGRYLAFRAGNLPAHNTGASLMLLSDVAKFNVGQAFGDEAGEALRRLTGGAAAMQQAVRPVDTDNRLHAWEWRVLPDGRLIKTDALDHSSSHDLVGCQDIAWDIAGAILEHQLSDGEAAQVVGIVETSCGVPVDQALLQVLLPCYLGFQIGLWTMARDAADDLAKPAITELLGRYERQLNSWCNRQTKRPSLKDGLLFNSV